MTRIPVSTSSASECRRLGMLLERYTERQIYVIGAFLRAATEIRSQMTILEGQQQIRARPEDRIPEDGLVTIEGREVGSGWVGKEFQVPGKWVVGASGDVELEFRHRHEL